MKSEQETQRKSIVLSRIKLFEAQQPSNEEGKRMEHSVSESDVEDQLLAWVEKKERKAKNDLVKNCVKRHNSLSQSMLTYKKNDIVYDQYTFSDYGLYEFDANKNGYFVEAYNQFDNELVFCYVEITKEKFNFNDLNKECEENCELEYKAESEPEDTNFANHTYENVNISDIILNRVKDEKINKSFDSHISNEYDDNIYENLKINISSNSNNHSSVKGNELIVSSVNNNLELSNNIPSAAKPNLEFNNNENYIVEAYNQFGNELVYLYFEFTNGSETELNNLDLNIDENCIFVDKLQGYYHIPGNSLNGPDIDTNDTSENVSFKKNVIKKNTVEDTLQKQKELTENLKLNFTLNEALHDENDLSIINKTLERPTKNKDYNFPVIDNENYYTLEYHQPNIQSTPSTRKKDKTVYILDELISTEKHYIEGLYKVITDYCNYLVNLVEPSLVGKPSYIFGNIETIYQMSKELLNQLQSNPKTPDTVAEIFLASKELFDLYPQYSKNKPTADKYLKEFDHIIKERHLQLKDRLDLHSYLLTPIQRLGKYKLMFESLQKENEKCNRDNTKIELVINKVKSIMRKGNDNIAIDSIKKCPVNLSEYGSFIVREKFFLHKPKRMDIMVFLFDGVIVFAMFSQNLEEFNYLQSISMDDICFNRVEDSDVMFELWKYSKNKKKQNPVYQLEAKDLKSKQSWAKMIEDILHQQLVQVKNLQTVLNQQEGKRHSRIPVKRQSLERKIWNQSKTFVGTSHENIYRCDFIN